MKQLTARVLSFILAISTVFSLSGPAFAAGSENVPEDIPKEDGEYILIDAVETSYGTVYQVQPNDGIQTAEFGILQTL